MKTNFETFFRNSLDSPPPIGMVMKYNVYRTDKKNENLIFVEGCSDERFYGKTKYDCLSQNSVYIYQDYAEKNGGKESVFYAYKQIKDNVDLREDSNRCIYIVDRDWDTTLRSHNKWVNKKDEPFITLTQGHSMECYFLEDENIRIIFHNLNVENHIDDFFEARNCFVEETIDFWAYKSVIQYANKSGVSCKYRKIYGFDQIFTYDFSKEPFFRYEYMIEENERMKQAIADNEQLVRYFSIWQAKIKDAPRFVRGHDYFNFLLAYLRYVLKKNIPERVLFDLVDKLDVDIDVKKG